VLALEGDGITVSVLEPGADLARLGSRYCSGGYVWQVTDERHGELLAGPCYPAPEPPPFDGQGAPEVFELALGQHESALGHDVYVLGVGRVRRESPVRPFHVRDNPTVTERAEWDLDVTRSSLRATTSAEFRSFGLELVRKLEVSGRTLTSTTRVTNLGAPALPLRWFAHPFFPWADARCCRLSLEYALPPGAALLEDDGGFVTRRAGADWASGHYVVPRVALGGELSVEQCHPKLGAVHVRCRFPLGGLALWGNARTFSFEPFFQTLLESGSAVSWSIQYVF
jgi:hypothetical protein